MPSKSAKQARAMRAAASGRSNLNIPKKVGKEFVKADKAKAAKAAKAIKSRKGRQ